MLFSVLLVLAAQAPSVAVVLTSHRAGAEGVAAQVATRVLETCRREGLATSADVSALAAAGVSDPRTCNGSRACLDRIAVVLGARAVVVGVDVAVVAGQVSIHLEAVQAGEARSLATQDLLAPVASWGDLSAAGLAGFARQVKERLTPAPVPATDAPLRPAASPSLTPSPAVVASAPLRLAPRSTTAATVTAVGSGVALAAAVGLLWSGLADRSTYQAGLFTASDGALASRLPESEARALAANANGKVAGAVVAAVVGVALGGVSAYLFTRPNEP